MRVAGGVIAIVVGAIQTITMALLVFTASAVQQMVTTAATGTTDPSAAQMGAAVAETAALAGLWGWIYLILSILILVFGIVVCASRNPMNGMILLVLGIVMVALGIIFYSGIIGLLWAALSLLAGVLAYLGMKQTRPAMA